MKKNLLKFACIALIICASITLTAQTAGTLTFTFTPVTKTPNYNSGQNTNVLAVWIQTSAGVFVKTKLRYVGNVTNDHLPIWAANASCSGGSATSGACNTVDGTTGATLNSFSAKTITWDGKKGPAATGTLQPDGIYKVTIQETWNHGTGGTATSSYTFTKGPSVDHRTISADPVFGNILIDWVPVVTTGIENISDIPQINVYPNPTNGVFNINYTKANNIKVINTLGMVVFDEKFEESTSGAKSIDLTNFADGIYLINVSNENGSSKHKVILTK